MTDDILKLRETTNPAVSGTHVGIANIYERDLPDANGVVAPRLSAVLAIADPTSAESRREIVTVDSVVTIGPDRYCVIAIDEGDQLGWVSLRKLAR